MNEAEKTTCRETIRPSDSEDEDEYSCKAKETICREADRREEILS